MSMIDDAKEKLRLVDYLVEVLGEPAIVGAMPRWNSCLSCGKSKGESRKLRLSRNGEAFFCAKCGAKGDVVQAVQLCENKATAIEAARWILYSDSVGTKVSCLGESIRKRTEESVATTECLSKLFDALADVKNQAAVNYLLHDRALSPNTIVRAKADGLLRFLPKDPAEAISLVVHACGEDLLRESGLWRKGAKAPGIAFRPLVIFFPDRKGAEFRLARDQKGMEPKAIRYGVTNMPWVLKGKNDKIWSLTEGVIDMWSIPSLTPAYPGCIMGIPGCNNWVPEWFSGLSGKRVYICFDNDLDDPDNPGQTWAKKAFDELTKIGADPILWLPEGAKDINALLVQKKRK